VKSVQRFARQAAFPLQQLPQRTGVQCSLCVEVDAHDLRM
jgi:hypothetical protein